MKNPIIPLSVIVMLLIILKGCNGDKPPIEKPPIDPDSVENSASYFEDQLVVIYKNQPSQADKQKIEQHIHNWGIQIDSIQECNHCDTYVELWHGDDIPSTIHAQGVSAGTGLKHKNVGEDNIAYYSVNYKMPLPYDSTYNISEDELKYYVDSLLRKQPMQGQEPIVIAVLDTGFDPFKRLVNSYLWNNPTPDDGQGCYPNDLHGWNFIGRNGEIWDDNKSQWHGTFVSQFIINEFLNSTSNFPQIMSLKTHDANGIGSLFTSICAIHYAMEKGAKIINASWGFYDNELIGHPYLNHLIAEVLKEQGIVFVTAAGNKIPEVDSIMLKNGIDSADLRDIAINNFYPARLNHTDANNIFTVTTIAADKISPTQNYSDQFVDVGVMADDIKPDMMLFNLPNINRLVSGSSYATAIFTGKIGAFLPKNMYQPNIDKITIISNMQNQGSVIHTNPALTGKIRNGCYVDR